MPVGLVTQALLSCLPCPAVGGLARAACGCCPDAAGPPGCCPAPARPLAPPGDAADAFCTVGLELSCPLNVLYFLEVWPLPLPAPAQCSSSGGWARRGPATGHGYESGSCWTLQLSGPAADTSQSSCAGRQPGRLLWTHGHRVSMRDTLIVSHNPLSSVQVRTLLHR